MIERICGYYDDAENLEKFHKLAFFQIKDYLGRPIELFENQEEWFKVDPQLAQS